MVDTCQNPAESRLSEKVEKLHQDLSQQDQLMMEAYTKGIVEGFTKEPLTKLVWVFFKVYGDLPRVFLSHSTPLCFPLPRSQKAFRKMFEAARKL